MRSPTTAPGRDLSKTSPVPLLGALASTNSGMRSTIGRCNPPGHQHTSSTRRLPPPSCIKQVSTVKMKGKKILKGQLTIGLDLGDRSSCYCVLDENGEIIREQKIPTTPEGMQQAFGKMARSRIAMETGTHSPWVSRVLTELGHEVIVAHAQKVRLIVKSRRKDDRLDARTHYILGPFGEDSDLRRWGLKLSARGGKNAKKRAVVAVARKLAVLLH